MATYDLGDISVTTIGYEVTPVASARRRRRDGAGIAPGATAPDDLDRLLHAADFQMAGDFALAPDAAMADLRTRRGPRSQEPSAALTVPVAPGEMAVLLVEDDAGVLSWHMPEPTGAGHRSRRGGKDVLEFRIASIPRGGPTQARRRGPILDWAAEKIAEPIRVRVLRFLVSRTIAAALDRIEGKIQTGPVVLQRGLSVDQWLPAPLAPAIAAQPIKRVLLLIHGTFSSTAGSFGALKASPWFDSLFERYDLVLGYDHRTLGEDTETNAEAILATLHALDLPPDCVIDAIAYSRGGLILRLLCEELLPQSQLPITIDRAIFVGCTNSGTMLAEPANWEDLVNLYTNILVGATKLIGGLSGGMAATAAPLVAYAITTLGRFVQMLPQVAISERHLPGLAAMEPEGDLVLRLNEAGPAPGFAARYHAVTSEFEPGGGGGLGRRAAMFLADRAIDRLLGQANDLVVHTASMTGFGKGRAAEKVHALGKGGHVFHTIYFATPEAMEPLAAWLDLPIAGAGKPAAQADITPDVDRPRRRRNGPSSRGGLAGIGAGPKSAPPSRDDLQDVTDADLLELVEMEVRELRIAPDAASAEAVPAPAPAARTPDVAERYIAAEMEPMPHLAKIANVYVTISPNEIVVADHEAAATLSAPAVVRQDRQITLRVIPRANCEVVGRDACEIAPDTAEEVITKFRLKGLAAGPGEVLVEARQGVQTLASFLLRPVFVSEEPLREVQQGIAVASADPDSAVLRIYEFTGLGETTLRFDLSSEGSDIALLETVRLPGKFDLKTYAAETLKDVEDAWNLVSKTGKQDKSGKDEMYLSFLERIRNQAKSRTAELIPEPIRRCLWKNRSKIKTIQVISEEPYLPWELMYLFDPDRGTKDGEGFFAERGLIRWLHNAPLRRMPPRLDGATSRYVIPEYLDDADALPAIAAEKAMLAERLPGIRPVTATSRAVRAFLADEAKDCTVLHFACHGETTQRSVIDSTLKMTELVHADDSLVSDPLAWQDVKEELDFGPGGAPLVFLNACQTGRAGGGILGTSGFADAFIRPRSKRGASIFVGALWSVDDELATQFADRFYECLLGKASLVDAVHQARKACQANLDFSWLAYSVYCAV